MLVLIDSAILKQEEKYSEISFTNLFKHIKQNKDSKKLFILIL